MGVTTIDHRYNLKGNELTAVYVQEIFKLFCETYEVGYEEYAQRKMKAYSELFIEGGTRDFDYRPMMDVKFFIQRWETEVRIHGYADRNIDDKSKNDQRSGEFDRKIKEYLLKNLA